VLFVLFCLIDSHLQYFLTSFSRMRLCVGFCSSCNSKLFWLLFFEPLGIAFETLQVIQPVVGTVTPEVLSLFSLEA
jgi:hypothetical protein